MRDLTEKELKLAPDWAGYYCVTEFDMAPHCITFYSEGWHQWVYHISEAWSPKITSERIPRSARVIPKKPFDISEHELFTSGIISKHKNDRDLHVNHLMWDLDKGRAIAIAKALGVTANDLS